MLLSDRAIARLWAFHVIKFHEIVLFIFGIEFATLGNILMKALTSRIQGPQPDSQNMYNP